jgi:hypothetical protein
MGHHRRLGHTFTFLYVHDFISHWKHTYGPPRSVMEIATLLYLKNIGCRCCMSVAFFLHFARRLAPVTAMWALCVLVPEACTFYFRAAAPHAICSV